MVTHGIPVPDCSDDVQRSLRRNVDRLIPTWVQIAIYDPRLGQALLILIAKYNIRITVAADITSFEVLCFDYLNGEDVVIDLLLPLTDRWRMALNYGGTCIHVYLMFQFVKLSSGKVNVVELHEGLEPMLALQSLMVRSIYKPPGRS